MRIDEIELRKSEIREMLNAEDTSALDLDALTEEVRSLDNEIKGIEERAAKEAELRNSVALGKTETTIIEERKESIMDEQKVYGVDSPEYRTAFFKSLQRKELNEVEKRAMTTASGSAGAAVPTETANEIVSKMLEVAPMLSEITLLRAAKGITIATGLERDEAYIHAEGAEITASTDVLAQVTLGAYGFAKIIKISLEVQTMAIDAFESWLVNGIAEAIALKIEKAIIRGTGSNEPHGLASITLTAGTNLISTTADLTFNDVCTLMTYPDKGFRKNGKFLCNSSFPYTQMAALNATNPNAFVQSLAEGVPNRLMGKEVLISDEVPDNELWYGEYKRIFGNLSKDIAVDVSTEADFDKALVDYRGYAMFDCQVAAPRAFGKWKKN